VLQLGLESGSAVTVIQYIEADDVQLPELAQRCSQRRVVQCANT
jgi:hypothetical protein